MPLIYNGKRMAAIVTTNAGAVSPELEEKVSTLENNVSQVSDKVAILEYNSNNANTRITQLESQVKNITNGMLFNTLFELFAELLRDDDLHNLNVIKNIPTNLYVLDKDIPDFYIYAVADNYLDSTYVE